MAEVYKNKQEGIEGNEVCENIQKNPVGAKKVQQVYKKNQERINRIIYFDEPYRQNILNDLLLVGEEKSVGYLPLSTLKGCKVEIKEIRKELEAKGLTVIEFTEEEIGIKSGALYTYNRDALQRILESGKLTLEKYEWPLEPDEFIRHLKIIIPTKDEDLFRLIMQVFADPRLKIPNYKIFVPSRQ